MLLLVFLDEQILLEMSLILAFVISPLFHLGTNDSLNLIFKFLFNLQEIKKQVTEERVKFYCFFYVATL